MRHGFGHHVDFKGNGDLRVREAKHALIRVADGSVNGLNQKFDSPAVPLVNIR